MTALIKEVTQQTQHIRTDPLISPIHDTIIKEVTQQTQHVRTDPLISPPHDRPYQSGNVTNATCQNKPPYQPST